MNEAKSADSPLILCVCSGNIGRSPIMAAELRRLCGVHNIKNVRVESSGIQGVAGTQRPKFNSLAEYPEGSIMIPLLTELGIDLSTHRYRVVTRERIAEAKLILVASEDIRSTRPNALLKQFPEYGEKMFLLSEMAGQCDDVPDFGGSMDAHLHQRSLQMILTLAEKGFARICKKIRQSSTMEKTL